ncbi:MAG: nitroreductase family protein [candidate division WOR-3 bacterium]|nr:nitroreductase family protein [candidate division WOR-3 bacterium]
MAESVYDVIMRRRSVRSFLDTPVEEEKVQQLLDAAIQAPSGGNIQPISIIRIEKPESRDKLAKLAVNQPWVAKAPLCLLFCIDFHRTGKWAQAEGASYGGEKALMSFLLAYADVFCSAENAVLCATSLGLGTVYIGMVLAAMTEIRSEFGLPDKVVPVVALCVGYPKKIPAGITKLPKAAMVHSERYEEKSPEELKQLYREKYGDLTADVKKYFERTYQEALEMEEQSRPGFTDKVARLMARMEVGNAAQLLFKMRYPDEAMKRMGESIIKSLREAGIECL